MPGMAELIKELLFYVKPETHLLGLGGRGPVFFLVILIWGLKFIFMPLASNDVFDSIWHGNLFCGKPNCCAMIMSWRISRHPWNAADDVRLCLGRIYPFKQYKKSEESVACHSGGG